INLCRHDEIKHLVAVHIFEEGGGVQRKGRGLSRRKRYGGRKIGILIVARVFEEVDLITASIREDEVDVTIVVEVVGQQPFPFTMFDTAATMRLASFTAEGKQIGRASCRERE